MDYGATRRRADRARLHSARSARPKRARRGLPPGAHGGIGRRNGMTICQDDRRRTAGSRMPESCSASGLARNSAAPCGVRQRTLRRVLEYLPQSTIPDSAKRPSGYRERKHRKQGRNFAPVLTADHEEIPPATARGPPRKRAQRPHFS